MRHNAARMDASGRPRVRSHGVWADAWSALATVIIVGTALTALPRLYTWAVTNGAVQGGPLACQDSGACWSFIAAKLPFILFGIYPQDERWRAVAAVAVIVILVFWSMPRRNWTGATLLAWAAGTTSALVLLAGGAFGLTAIPSASWGGLPVTLLLTVACLAIGFPLGVALAFARRSRLPAFRWTATVFIEITRALPLVTMLFAAALVVPLLLPDGVSMDNLLRAAIALTLSAAAYFAEVVRGGLQATPHAQEEAARALGLGWASAMRLVILPQALRKVLPPLTNTVIVIVKNTSIVLVIGLFDLVSAGRTALADPAWPTPFAETYGFIALVYFAICYGLTRYGRHLERIDWDARP